MKTIPCNVVAFLLKIAACFVLSLKFSKNHGLKKESKMQLKRKIDSLKSTLNVLIVIKVFYIKNIKHIETAYQLY